MAGERAGVRTLVAEFATEGGLVAALEAVRRDGARQLDAYTPIPSERVDRVLGAGGAAVPVVALACGLTGAAATYALQYLSSIADYPFLVGGKPYDSWPPFLVVAFAAGLLSTVLGAMTAMLVGNRLPRLNHPIFDVEGIDGASRDRWFLAVSSNGPAPGEPGLRRTIEAHHPIAIRELQE